MKTTVKQLITSSLFLIFATALLLGGCGSSDSDSGTASKTTEKITGIAATGAPLSGTVTVKDSSTPSKELSVQTNAADGSFSCDVSAMSGPFILKASGSSASGENTVLYSFTETAGTVNINPLSNLAVTQANGGADPATVFDSPTTTKLQNMKSNISSCVSDIKSKFSSLLTEYNAQNSDFIKGSYRADHTGLDLMFDVTNFKTANGSVTVTNTTDNSTICTASINSSNNTLSISGQLNTSNIPKIAQNAGNVIIMPKNKNMSTGSKWLFLSVVTGTLDQSVTWSVAETGGGTITNAGLYTAPATPGTYHVTATSVKDSSKSATATVTVTAAN